MWEVGDGNGVVERYGDLGSDGCYGDWGGGAVRGFSGLGWMDVLSLQ